MPVDLTPTPSMESATPRTRQPPELLGFWTSSTKANLLSPSLVFPLRISDGSLPCLQRKGILYCTSGNNITLHHRWTSATQDVLATLGKSLQDVGLPQAVARRKAVDAELLAWSGDPDDLHSFASSLTADQRRIYDRLREICQMETPKPVHIDGRAGRGKTYCLYPLIGALRKKGKITLVVASSAFAAKNYPGGRTEHFQYGVPVDENNPFLESAITAKSDRATSAHPNMTDSPLATPDFLNVQKECGIPPHELKLKVGSVCGCVRNLSGSSQGITKNTRAIVACLHRHSVEVQTLLTVLGRRIVPSMTFPVPGIDFTYKPLSIASRYHWCSLTR
ncbi:hypothetical protein EXIGLDRAFT_761968 [Exidia glandulosa HHB12029]|uniref:ATP-dependent DNA helicase n=1 Tax=Exidia glandulosa HHB12029 TaxID=1314781 RepID=A0A165N262_EXIGL|nr:hypothetical protein EXIGLDRAFT_761968 [Exidia glandulosa HHB12029]